MQRSTVKKLAELFEKGVFESSGGSKSLGLAPGNAAAILGIMEHHGIIENPMHLASQRYAVFRITAAAVEVSRKIAEAEAKKLERKDIVELVKLTLKKHPITAWGFLVVAFIIFAATAVTQIAGALKALGVTKSTSP